MYVPIQYKQLLGEAFYDILLICWSKPTLRLLNQYWILPQSHTHIHTRTNIYTSTLWKTHSYEEFIVFVGGLFAGQTNIRPGTTAATTIETTKTNSLVVQIN